MQFRPATDSFSDYAGVQKMYLDWKHVSFSYADYKDYISRLCDLQCGLFVVEQNNEIIGTCKIILEPKLVFGTSVCHMEDVVVLESKRKHGVGSFMIKTVIDYCKNNKWDSNIMIYKLRLSCHEELKPFYGKNDLKQAGFEMVHYFI
jgi:GNAT superfamily N-acetyltransferase